MFLNLILVRLPEEALNGEEWRRCQQESRPALRSL